MNPPLREQPPFLSKQFPQWNPIDVSSRKKWYSTVALNRYHCWVITQDGGCGGIRGQPTSHGPLLLNLCSVVATLSHYHITSMGISGFQQENVNMRQACWIRSMVHLVQHPALTVTSWMPMQSRQTEPEHNCILMSHSSGILKHIAFSSGGQTQPLWLAAIDIIT